MTDIAELIGKQSEAIEKRLNESDAELRELKGAFSELEQKASRGGGRSDDAETIGAMFTGQKGVELATMGRNDKVAFETKASITSATANAAGSAGALIVPARDATVSLPKRRLTIRNLLNVIKVESGSVEYANQVSRATGAAMVAEGAQKPESDLQWDLKNAPIRTIAHWTKASRQILDDAPQLQGLIDTELRYGLALMEEAQLLYGDGTGQNLLGMVPQAAQFDNALREAGDTRIDTIGRAILQASLTDIEPDGIVIHPSDWWAMRLLKNADGEYILGDPMQSVDPNLFGLPVIPTKANNVGEFTVGAFGAQTLYDRWEARIEVGSVNDDFVRNLVTVLGEERIGFAAKQPGSIVNGTFAAPAQ